MMEEMNLAPSDWLTNAERNEFDSANVDSIRAIKDLAKLKRMEKYYELTNFPETAGYVRKHMADLGHKDPRYDPEQQEQTRRDLEDERKGIADFSAAKQREEKGLAALKAQGLHRTPASTAPPPRPPATITVAPVKDKQAAKDKSKESKVADTAKDQGAPAASSSKPPKQDSKFGGQVRSGSDYYKKWDQFAEQAVKEADKEDRGKAAPGKANVPSVKAPAGGSTATGQGAVPVVGSGAKLTQQILEANATLTDKERSFLSEQEKIKGNEFFRSKEYAQAVEHYTRSLGYCSDSAHVYGNRAAAYYKLKMYPEVVSDCDSALGHDSTYLKAYVRRAAARLELNQAQEAMQDIEAGLALEPGHKELQTMQQRASKVLGLSTMKRMIIQEVDDDDDEEEEVPINKRAAAASATPAQTATAPPPRSSQSGADLPRTRITVVEETDSEDESETVPAPAAKSANSKAAAGASVAGVAPSPARPESRRTQIPIVEGSEDDSDGEGDAGGKAAEVPKGGVEKPAGMGTSKKAKKNQRKRAAAAAAAAATGGGDAAAADGQADSKELSVSDSTTKPVAAEAPKPSTEPASKAGTKSGPAKPAAVIELKPPPAPEAPRAAKLDTAKAPSTAPKPAVPAAAEPAPPSAPAEPAGPASSVAAAAAPVAAAPAPAASAPVAPAAPAVRTLDEEADALQEEGKRVFTAGNYKRALDIYTQALELKPDSSTLHTNRALARFKMGDFKQCLIDACLAVALDPSNPKAMHRRAQAKAKLGLLKSACEDFKIAEGLVESSQQKEEISKERLKVEVEINKLEKIKEARRAQANKVTQYKGGLTIEEHDQDEEEEGAHMSQSQLARMEQDASNKSHTLKKRAEAVRQKRQQQLEEAAAAQAATALPSQPAKTTTQAAPVAAEPAPAVAQRSVAAADTRATEAAGKGSASSAAVSKVDTAESKVQPAPGPAATAEGLKEQGKQLFATKDLHGAVAAWEKALTLTTEGSALAVACQANIAMASLELKDYEGALAAAEAVLKVDVDNTKGLHRKALALKHLGRLEESVRAYNLLRKQLPASPLVTEELSAVLDLWRSEREAAKQAPASSAVAPPKPDESAPAAQAPDPAAAPATADIQPKPTKTPVAVDNEEEAKHGQAQDASAASARDKPAEPKQATATQAAQAKQQADSERDAGNELFRQNKLEEALQAYDNSLVLYETHEAHANRGLLLLKLQQPVEAEKACRRALALQPHYPKALQRLARALEAQGRLEEAVPMFAQVAEQTNSPQTQEEYQKAKQALLARQQEQRAAEGNVPVPTKRHKIQIQETNSSESEEEDEEDQTHLPVPPVAAAVAAAAQKAASGTDSGVSVAASEAPAAAVNTADAAQGAEAGAVDGSQGGSQAGSSRRSSSGNGAVPHGKLHELAAAKAAAARANLASKQPNVPKNAVEFGNGCKLIGNDTELLGSYIASIEPSSYPSLFKQALEVPLVTHLLRGINQVSKSDPQFAYQALTSLPEVGRWGMVSSMMPKGDKTMVTEVLDRVAAVGLDTAGLRKAYRV